MLSTNNFEHNIASYYQPNSPLYFHNATNSSDRELAPVEGILHYCPPLKPYKRRPKAATCWDVSISNTHQLAIQNSFRKYYNLDSSYKLVGKPKFSDIPQVNTVNKSSLEEPTSGQDPQLSDTPKVMDIREIVFGHPCNAHKANLVIFWYIRYGMDVPAYLMSPFLTYCSGLQTEANFYFNFTNQNSQNLFSNFTIGSQLFPDYQVNSYTNTYNNDLFQPSSPGFEEDKDQNLNTFDLQLENWMNSIETDSDFASFTNAQDSIFTSTVDVNEFSQAASDSKTLSQSELNSPTGSVQHNDLSSVLNDPSIVGPVSRKRNLSDCDSTSCVAEELKPIFSDDGEEAFVSKKLKASSPRHTEDKVSSSLGNGSLAYDSQSVQNYNSSTDESPELEDGADVFGDASEKIDYEFSMEFDF